MVKDGNIRMYITEACNAKCPNCFNRFNRTNSSMDIDIFEKICIYFRDNGISNIKIMGGEPTIHPDFSEITKVAQKHFKTVSVFTNAINDNIQDFEPRENDSIIYNFKFANLLNKEKLLIEKSGRRSLEIQITSTTNTNKVIESISRLLDINGSKVLNPCLTLDCTENIFKYRRILVEKYEKIWHFCRDNGLTMGQDHLIPFCFIAGTKIPMSKEGAICRLSCAGLIDSSYNIKFCNQFSKNYISLFDNGEFIEFEKYINFLKNQYTEIVNLSSKKGCSRCSVYGLLCNGGCFASKDTIFEDDICKHIIE